MAGLDNRPLRQVSYNKKVANDFEYCKQWINWIVNQSRRGLRRYTPIVPTSGDYIEDNYSLYYQLANGYIPKEWFNYVTNAFNYGNDKTLASKSLPSKIDDFNVVYPTLSYLEGKKQERPFNWMVENINHTASTKKIEDINKQINEELIKIWLGEEDAANSPVQFEQRINEFVTNYKDKLAEEGQDILTYALQYDKTREKIIEMWKHWLIVGETYTYINVEKDNVVTLPISPIQINYGVSSNTFNSKYAEDADWLRVEYEMSVVEIVDKFGHLLTDKQLKEIEQTTDNFARLNILFNYDLYTSTNREWKRDRHLVYHCQWVTFKKVGIVTYPNPITFEEEKLEVDESFKLTDDLIAAGYTIRWEWQEERWEGWKINDKYLGIRPLPVQNGKFNYFGKRWRDLHTRNTSIVHMALPYIKLYCVLWFKLQLIIVKSKGTGTAIPVDLLTGMEGKEGWSLEKVLHMLESTGLLIYDKSVLTSGETLPNYMSKVEISQLADAMTIIQMIDYVKMSWLNMVGLSPAALAQQTGDKGLGVTQSELYQSSVITEPIFTQFEYLEERMLQAILDYTKYAYIEGKRATVVRDDSSVAYLNVDGKQWAYEDMGVFLTRSGEESRILEGMRAAAMDKLATQGQDPAKLLQIMAAKNSAKLLTILNELKDMEMKNAQQQMENEERLKQETIAIEKQFKEFESQLKVDETIQIDNNRFINDRELELIKLQANQLSFQGTMDSNVNNVPDVTEVAKLSNERLKIEKDSLLKLAELQLKNKEIDSKERTEKLKAKTQLKNKVSGEK